mgnify:CR=1 FL=1
MKTFVFFAGCLLIASLVRPALAAPADGREEPSGAAPIPAGLAEAAEAMSPEAVQRAHDRGVMLYEQGEYEAAFPHLLAAAERGFTHSQARLGALYLYGYGVKRSDLKGLAWLGVAARGSNDDRIAANFDSVWRRVPQAHMARVEAEIDEYEARYGPSARPAVPGDAWDHSYPDDVVASRCVLTRAAGSHIKQEVCGAPEATAEYLDELEREVRFQDGIGTRREEIYEDPLLRAFDHIGLQL